MIIAWCTVVLKWVSALQHSWEVSEIGERQNELPHLFRRLVSEGGVAQAPDFVDYDPKAPDVTGSGVLAVMDGLQRRMERMIRDILIG